MKISIPLNLLIRLITHLAKTGNIDTMPGSLEYEAHNLHNELSQAIDKETSGIQETPNIKEFKGVPVYNPNASYK